MTNALGLSSHGVKLAAVVCWLAFAGCGGGPSDPAARSIRDANRNNIQRLGNLYDRFQTANQWRGPGSEEEFKDFIRNLNQQTLDRMGVDPAAVDELFISERDNQPFVIKYGEVGSSRGAPMPVIFEQEGVGGKREVGFTRMKKVLAEEAEYNELLNGS